MRATLFRGLGPILMILAICAVLLLPACAVSNATKAAQSELKPPPKDKTPAEFKHTANGLDVLIGVGILALIAGVAVYFWFPEHTLSYALVTGGSATFGVSAVLRATLWLIPYIAYSLLCIGAVAFIWELVKKFSDPASSTTTNAASNATAAASTSPTTLIGKAESAVTGAIDTVEADAKAVVAKL